MTGPLTPHDAERLELPGPHGPVAALSTKEAGKAIALLVHGYTGSKEDFAPVLDAIADDGFRAVAIDLPGTFESPGPEDESAYLPAALGQVVASVAEHLANEGKPVLLLGHSYGGLVARAAVLAGAPVAGLTLMDTGPSALPEGHRRTALALGEPLLRRHGIEAAYRIREEMNAQFPGWLALPEELREFYRHRFVSSSPQALLGMADGLRYEPDLVATLAEALRERTVPALVVAGEGDDAWSVPSQRDMAQRLGVPFETVPHAAHSPNTENPQGLLDVLLPTWRSWL
ncbi:pimeloyl-ACP methyl ester carboxylesterase [Amycolatopsis bartoniae]|uniref:Alpha/beta hydrolase n=1 Tax=Amycolatopsis bartoniae TaxID=941986 RepID=A0A8H9J2B0_9PSEU|nr:alpha/beta hydrolase [Amycolatopsis bartoniae]MBB2937233.1 pimeloyl-ACP methyl ester carboxylesterase [Amycolatopsis bartoniae]TVS98936.1 alpha/beta fold hydrolase [Amycolatopsis bartoniae]GHF77501.1 alpha/beta hydrolase [Amycolatopsis bartoniae]